MMKINLLNVKISTKNLLIVPISVDYKEAIFKEFTKDITTYMYPRPAKNIKETEDFIKDSLKELKKGDNL